MIGLLVYLSGYIASYLLIRLASKRCDEWTIGNRNLTIMISSLSWLLVCAIIISYIIEKVAYILDEDSDKPAKW